MAGQPVRRARRLERDKAIREPVHWQADRGLSEGERLALIAGNALSRIEELIAIPWHAAKPGEQNLQVRVFELLLKRVWKESDRRAESAIDALREAQESWSARAEQKKEPGL